MSVAGPLPSAHPAARSAQGRAVNAVLQRPSPWQRLKPVFVGFDLWRAVAIGCLAALGLVSMYSAGFAPMMSPTGAGVIVMPSK